MFRFLRRLLLIILIAGLFGAVSYYIIQDDYRQRLGIYHDRATLAVSTAIANRQFELTRTAEADFPQYRLVQVQPGEPLINVAERYRTTIDVLRMANKLLPNVDAGDGSTLVIPEGITQLDPPRSFIVYMVVAGDTFEALSVRYGISIEQLQMDNPVLATRNLVPGDAVFIAEILG
jgi:LysM repeat protein